MFYKMRTEDATVWRVDASYCIHAVMISLLRILVYPVLSFDSWAKSVSKNAQNTKKTSKGKTEKLHMAAKKLFDQSFPTLYSTPSTPSTPKQ